MIRLRKFSLGDYEDVVDMFYEFCKEVYNNRKIGYKYAYYMIISDWIKNKCDIIVAEDEGKIIGFTMSRIDNMNGLTEPIYNGEYAFVYKEYRKTRAAYLLYKNVVDYAKQIGLKLVSNGRVENGVSDMIQKHFGVEPQYIIFEKEQ